MLNELSPHQMMHYEVESLVLQLPKSTTKKIIFNFFPLLSLLRNDICFLKTNYFVVGCVWEKTVYRRDIQALCQPTMAKPYLLWTSPSLPSPPAPLPTNETQVSLRKWQLKNRQKNLISKQVLVLFVFQVVLWLD